jgi:predicted acylesterase/phospholipase RssA
MTVEHRPLTLAEFEQIEASDEYEGRWWGDEAPPNLEELMNAYGEALRERYPEAVNAAPETAPMQSVLALSGGGANGAFGAGLLAGWTESGERPEFEIVTGVSTGAMIAPFAYLGSDYDSYLIDMYSNITSDDLFRTQLFSGALFGSALTDNWPLQELVKSYVTQELVSEVAAQHRRGRLLHIVTTHFDAQRPMVWDIGDIANRRGADAVPLIRKIILASAAIPGLFPPVPIEWENNGKRYTELHVDGGISRQLYVYPSQVSPEQLDDMMGLTFRRQIYVILNGNAQVGYEPAPVSVAPIAERALTALARNQANADIERAYLLAQRDGIGFQMIAIPDDYKADSSTNFEPEYMKSLLEFGRNIGRAGDFWEDRPPNT